ncbi:hypothetical protein CHS0354_034798 [Potamilus streckersoni]|uniref:Uncharacterized protein n=1 Tax=Potamilus streckersoni TaxID=2493646 RepID=A0AAE0VIM3_9BIVA|nr:hypothetical protein CHS0354_034798 [Potamilus streckersoni]
MNGKQKFAGKVAIVTGSTTGIGLAIAKRLAREGASVMISSRKQEHVDEALRQMRAENLNVSGMPCHVINAEHRKKMIQKFLNDLLNTSKKVTICFFFTLLLHRQNTTDSWNTKAFFGVISGCCSNATLTGPVS